MYALNSGLRLLTRLYGNQGTVYAIHAPKQVGVCTSLPMYGKVSANKVVDLYYINDSGAIYCMNAGGGCLTIANQAEEQSDGSGVFF